MLWFAWPWPPEPQPGPADAGHAPAASEAPDALGWWALRFTPRVARVDEWLLMEVTGSLRLWGGVTALQRRILEENPALAPEGIAQAAIGLIAIARGRLRHQGQAVPAGGAAALPLHTLGAARAHLPLLERLGLRTWGEVDSLPRAAMVRRFGTGLRAALDVAFGRAPESYPWLTLPERFDQALELPAHADAAPVLLWSASRLLVALQSWLRARQLGVLAFELGWTFDRRRLDGRALPPAQSLVIRTAQPAQTMEHLRRLLAERLARTSLLAPAVGLRLTALQTAPWQPGNASLLPDERRRGEPLHVLVERAGARLGPASVRRAVLRADHRPECRQHWQAVEGGGAPSPVEGGLERGRVAATQAVQGFRSAADPHLNLLPAGEGVGIRPLADALAPTWLLREPRPLDVQGGRPWHEGQALCLLSGPQRIEAGWWPDDPAQAEAARPAARDYFIAQSASAQLLWVFCERPSSHAPSHAPLRWFVHGVYA
ncbi:MAG: DNA polymerase Y family protein [Burkholderiaceae bacterium]